MSRPLDLRKHALQSAQRINQCALAEPSGGVQETEYMFSPEAACASENIIAILIFL